MSYQQIPLECSPEELLVYAFLSKYGQYSHYKIDTGRTVIVLPTCTNPLEHLIEENWDEKSRQYYCGNSRHVRQISQLQDGTHVYLFVKGPERIFNAAQESLPFHGVWWGGPKSGDKYVCFSCPVVEEQSLWESVFFAGITRARYSCRNSSSSG